jgi:hypothetical protein
MMRSGCATTDSQAAVSRRDVHNSNIDFEAAMVGRCGFRNLARGRVCLLAYAHREGCRFLLTPRPHRHVTDGAGSLPSTTDRAAR